MPSIISNPVAESLQKYLDARNRYMREHASTLSAPGRASFELNNETIGNSVKEINRLERALKRLAKSKTRTKTIIVTSRSNL